MSSDVTVRANAGCLSCTSNRKNRIDELREQFNSASSTIHTNLTTVGKIVKEAQTNYDFALTTEVIRKQLAALDSTREAILREQQALEQQTLCWGTIKTDYVIQGLHYVVEPLAILSGGATLAAELFKDASQQNSTNKKIGFGLLLGGAALQRIKDKLRLKIATYERTKRDIEDLGKDAAKSHENSEAMVSILERLDALTKKGEQAKRKEWRQLFYVAKHVIPKEYQTLIDPKEFQHFVKVRSPQARLRRIVSQAMQKKREDQERDGGFPLASGQPARREQARSPASSLPEVVLTVNSPSVRWHDRDDDKQET